MKTSAAKFTSATRQAASLPATCQDQQGTKKKIDAFLKAKGLHMDCSAWKRRNTA